MYGRKPCPWQNFNSRTHVECDANSEDQSATSFISTHALTWSATDGVVECDDYVKISTHALTWSATARRIHGAANREFQLTHSRGVRQFRHVLRTSPHTFQLTHSRGVRRAYLYPDLISIVDFNSRTHVECDIVPVFHVAQIFHFNSRTHVECDHKNPYCAISGGNFNSRTHVECDIFKNSFVIRPKHFNSRTHVECDSSIWNRFVFATISTHALTWSATCPELNAFWNSRISTHALTWSATRPFHLRWHLLCISTHALTWSATKTHWRMIWYE